MFSKMIFGVDSICHFLNLQFPASVIEARDYFGAPILKRNGVLCSRRKHLKSWKRENAEAIVELNKISFCERISTPAPSKPFLTRWEKNKRGKI